MTNGKIIIAATDKRKLLIGLDPGQQNGFAVWDGEKFLKMKTLTFWELVAELREIRDYAKSEGIELHVRLEWPVANKPVFDRANANEIGKRLRIAQNVGQNKNDAIRIAEFMEDNGISYEKCTPNKNSMINLNAERFRMITKYEGRTSQHVRDAAGYVWGR